MTTLKSLDRKKVLYWIIRVYKVFRICQMNYSNGFIDALAPGTMSDDFGWPRNGWRMGFEDLREPKDPTLKHLNTYFTWKCDYH